MRQYLRAIILLLAAITLTPASTPAAENPFQGFWRSANGTVVQIQGDQGIDHHRNGRRLYKTISIKYRLKISARQAQPGLPKSWL